MVRLRRTRPIGKHQANSERRIRTESKRFELPATCACDIARFEVHAQIARTNPMVGQVQQQPPPDRACSGGLGPARSSQSSRDSRPPWGQVVRTTLGWTGRRRHVPLGDGLRSMSRSCWREGRASLSVFYKSHGSVSSVLRTSCTAVPRFLRLRADCLTAGESAPGGLPLPARKRTRDVPGGGSVRRRSGSVGKPFRAAADG